MELVAGYPFWLMKSGIPFQYPKLTQDASSDVVIVGGGISGALTAYYCIEAGIDCMLVDGRSIGFGSTCASTSLLQYELDVPLHKMKKQLGNDTANRAWQLCGDAIDKLFDLARDIDFSECARKQSLFFSTHGRDKKMLERENAARTAAGFQTCLLSGSGMKKRFGLEAFMGILSQQGGTTNVYTFTHAILQHCMKKGLRVFDRTYIQKIDQKNEGLILKTADGHRIAVRYLVNASGYEVVNFINKKIVNLDCTYAMVSESLQEKTPLLDDGIIMWDTDNPYLYISSTSDRRIIVGGRDARFVNMKTMHLDLNKKTRLLYKDFREIFPSVEIKTEFSWSGVFGKTKDALPYIGYYPGTPRTLYALGFGGNGITFSVIAAEIIRDLLLGKKNENAEMFSFKR